MSEQESIIRCSNCGYEVDEVDPKTELCQTCKKAYDRGVVSKWWDQYALKD